MPRESRSGETAGFHEIVMQGQNQDERLEESERSVLRSHVSGRSGLGVVKQKFACYIVVLLRFPAGPVTGSGRWC